MPGGVYLTKEQQDAMIVSYGAGASQAQVARDFGVTAGGVSMMFKRRGVEKRDVPWQMKPPEIQAEFCRRYLAGETILGISRDTGASDKAIAAALKRRGIPTRMGGPCTYLEGQRDQWIAEYQAGESAAKIAARHGVSSWTVSTEVRRAGISRSHGANYLDYPPETIARIISRYTDGLSQIDVAQEIGIGQPAVSRILRLSGVEVRKNMRGQNHPSWKGGRHIGQGGYVIVRTDEFPEMRRVSGTHLEHRLVMARHLSRALTSGETVHHKNGDRQDNRIENLELRVGPHGKGATHAHCSTCTCFDH